jgi:hypothetical protein
MLLGKEVQFLTQDCSRVSKEGSRSGSITIQEPLKWALGAVLSLFKSLQGGLQNFKSSFKIVQEP